MAELLARGAGPGEEWRRRLVEEPVTLGRSTTRCAWAVPWDPLISGLHATLTWHDGRLAVRRAVTGRNPVFFRGIPADEFELTPGESFVIGETTFTLHDGPTGENSESDLPAPLSELTCSREELRSIRFLDADDRIAVLARLPEVIRQSPSESELESRVLDVLLEGVPRAEAAAVVQLLDTGSDTPSVRTHAVKVRHGRTALFRPSRRLVAAAARRKQSVLNTWQGPTGRDDYTAHVAYDWALCVPLPAEPTPGWGLYVAGRMVQASINIAGLPNSESLKGDLKFAELVGDIFGSLRQVRDLQSRQALLARFLSRPVLAAVARLGMEEVLKPRIADVTVMFCDLRGFSRLSEEGQGDLEALWRRVSAALAIMTGNIIGTDGVVGDFHGDAAMGFWGWPLPADDRAARAARAALAIRREFHKAVRDSASPLFGFSCGLGLASGPAMAGTLGTPDQHKVTLFGPVGNVASRLESFTRHFDPMPILTDAATAEMLDRPENSAWLCNRRLVKVRPQGMSAVVSVHELMTEPSEVECLSPTERSGYEIALDVFESGRWTEARSLLEALPQTDCGVRYLLGMIRRHDGAPPAGWDGVVDLASK